MSKKSTNFAAGNQVDTGMETKEENKVVEKMYDEDIEKLVQLALEDNGLTEKERKVLLKKAEAKGIDPDEFDMYLDTRLARKSNAQKESEPKESVRECPNCGKRIPASKTIGPACGWEVDVESADNQSAVYRLSQELKNRSLLNFQTEYTVIRSFPIPRGKSDLLELTIYFKTRCLSDFKDEIWDEEDECIQKYKECILKAKQYYSNDADFIPLIKDFDEELAENEARKAKRRRIIGIVSGIVGLAVIGLLVWYFSQGGN